MTDIYFFIAGALITAYFARVGIDIKNQLKAIYTSQMFLEENCIVRKEESNMEDIFHDTKDIVGVTGITLTTKRFVELMKMEEEYFELKQKVAQYESERE